MLRHLGDFPARLREHGHSLYEYTPCPPVGYPEIEVGGLFYWGGVSGVGGDADDVFPFPM